MMKKNNIFYALVTLTILATSFAWKFAAAKYNVIPAESKVAWLGKKIKGEHNGTIDVKSGELLFEGKILTGGHVIIDMTSIKNDDLKDAEYNKKLVGHLKSEDFFGVDKYPTSKLEITKVVPIAKAEAGKPNFTVTGMLTIKASSEELTFPATITEKGNEVTAKALVKVDRTKFDVKYGSKSFFDNLGDKVIDDIFELDITIKAKK